MNIPKRRRRKVKYQMSRRAWKRTRQGRATLPPSIRLGTRLNFRVTQSERRKIEESAAINGQKVSIWIRTILTRTLRGESKLRLKVAKENCKTAENESSIKIPWDC